MYPISSDKYYLTHLLKHETRLFLSHFLLPYTSNDNVFSQYSKFSLQMPPHL